MKKPIALLILVLLFLTCPSAAHAASLGAREVLVIHSYHYEFSWTHGVQTGIENALSRSGIPVNLQTEFMDARRMETQLHVDKLADLFAEKFRHRHFDVVIVSDNNALDFVVQYQKRLFPGIPVVFCGINDFHPDMLKGAVNFTGVAEVIDFRGTLAIALALHPQVKQVHIFGDNSVSYHAIRREILQALPEFSQQVSFNFYDGDRIEDVLERVAEFTPEDLVLCASSLRTRQNEHVPFEKMMESVSAASKVPVYSLWDFFLGHGMIGGKLVSGELQGEMAGTIAAQVLSGTAPSSIPIQLQTPTKYMFDYQQLQRFGVSLNTLPPDSVVINRPVTAYTVERSVILAVAVILGLALLIVPVLLYLIKKWRRLNQRLDSENKFLASLHEVALGLMNRLDLSELLEDIVQRAAEMACTEHGFIFLANPQQDVLVIRVGIGLHAGANGYCLRHGESMSGLVWDHGTTLCENHYQNSPLRSSDPKFSPIQAALTVPLKREGIVIGVIGLTFIEPGRAFSSQDIDVVTQFAELAAIAIDNAQLYEQSQAELRERARYEEKLHFLSYHDSMTGLFNRRYLDEELRRQNQRLSGSVGMLVCDVDGLKFLNDTFGHEQGDRLLITVAGILHVCISPPGSIARSGGDEFVVLLPAASEADLETVYRAIQKKIMQCNSSNPNIFISMSIGYSLSPSPAVSMFDAFKQADNNMYREKLHRSQSARSAMVQTVMRLLAERDFITEEHAGRMQDLVVELARHFGIKEEKFSDLRLFAQFHDIGKIGIPDSILKKAGPLTSEEMDIMKRHCEIGHRIVQASTELAPIADWVLKHQERWDGLGYPLGLTGAQIPLECRILAVVDAFDAMTSNRPYRTAMTPAQAIQELKRTAGTQFDPKIVDQFVRYIMDGPH